MGNIVSQAQEMMTTRQQQEEVVTFKDDIYSNMRDQETNSYYSSIVT